MRDQIFTLREKFVTFPLLNLRMVKFVTFSLGFDF